MVDTSISPYHDDFNESKNFHRVMYVPGRAVQVRELNQMQTILQNQIERFGDHIFENGSMVISGEINHDLAYEYVTLTSVDYSQIVNILNSNDVVVSGQTSGVTANVIQHTGNTVTDPTTLFIQYESASNSDINRFVAGENLILSISGSADFANVVASTIGRGSVLTVADGIFYTNGTFVRSNAQRVILDKYSTTPSVVVGFRLYDDIVSWVDDQSLVDNASGTSNLNAIGADRLRLRLVAEVHDIDAVFDRENFIELAKFRDGILQKKVRGPDYSILNDTLARRTYDQAGDYTVEAFPIGLREHLADDTNNGLYDVEDGGDESKFVVGIEAGKAYVRGYEVETIATEYIDVDKARDFSSINNSTFALPVGNYISVSASNILPKSSQFQKITFYSGLASTPGAIPAGSILGTARVRYSQLDSSQPRINIYLFDIRNVSGSLDSSFVTSAKSVYAAGSPAFTAKIESELIDSINSGLVYKLPVENIKSLLNNGSSDTSVSVIRQYSLNTDTNGTVILTAGSNEVFNVPNGVNSSASMTVGGTSSIVDISSFASLGGTPNGSTMTINLGAGFASTLVTINVEVIKQIGFTKAKTRVSQTITLQPSAMVNRRFSLNKADAIRIVSINQAGINKTNSYTLNKNTTPDYYGVSSVVLNSSESIPTTPVTIQFEYFLHGNGDFFSVDSYSSIDYSDIPFEFIGGEEVNLADVVDFRPRFNDTGVDFVSAGSSIIEVPAPYSLIRADVEHYLARIDTVYVSPDGEFGVARGVSANTPTAAKAPDNSMALYTLYIPAYTRDITKISSVIINNRRYTMRDIGKLEKRISDVEYYTTLSLLETETSSMQIVDNQTGLNRFKNGFIVDNFSDHSVGSFTLEDYKCSVSSQERILRPEFFSDHVDMNFSINASSNVVKTGSLITLPFSEKLFIQQNMASGILNVNPYAVYRWNGNVTLMPNSDTWFDTIYTTPEVTNQVFNNGRLTQQWNSWETNWTGGETTKTSFTTFNRGVATTTDTAFNRPHDRVGQITQTSTNSSVEVVGDRVVNTTVIPYMRSRNIQFNAKGLMPGSKVYALFDSVDVSAYCTQAGKTKGAAMFTDVDGNISGIFTIPNDKNMRFRTGTKQFTLIDNVAGIRETSLSYGDTSYTAKGTIITRTQSILATQKVSQTVRPWDPLAQSFFVETAGGVFVTSVELYFATKDNSSPVTIEIRNMVNGYPGQEVVPYSQLLLNPNEVNVSTNASAATKFTFDSPVYLADGNEYCFVVMSNSNDYNVYIGTMGQKMVDSNSYISKQPYIGVLFKSQNNTTWSADQTSDMKFKINTAEFQTNVLGLAQFINSAPEAVRLSPNSLISTTGSGSIVVQSKNHNLMVGSRVSISGVDVAPGFNITAINTTHTVTSVTLDTFTFVIPSVSAIATGSFGGDNVMADRHMVMNTFQPIVQEMLFENTNVDWYFAGLSGKSINGNEVPYNSLAAYVVAPNENFNSPVPLLIPNGEDADEKLNVPAARLIAGMQTFSSNVSPVIDSNRMGLIGVVNRINSPEVLNENGASGGNAVARYITKAIGIKNAANSLKVYVDVNKPQGSDVKLFYRLANSTSELSEKAWTEMPAIVSTVATDKTQFNEFEYGVNDVSAFSFYQYKIVMLSNSSSRIPQLKSFRGIALGT